MKVGNTIKIDLAKMRRLMKDYETVPGMAETVGVNTNIYKAIVNCDFTASHLSCVYARVDETIDGDITAITLVTTGSFIDINKNIYESQEKQWRMFTNFDYDLGIVMVVDVEAKVDNIDLYQINTLSTEIYNLEKSLAEKKSAIKLLLNL